MPEQRDEQQRHARQQNLALSWDEAGNGPQEDNTPPAAEQPADPGPPEAEFSAEERSPAEAAPAEQPADSNMDGVGDVPSGPQTPDPAPPEARPGPDAHPPLPVSVTALGEVEMSLGQALLEARGARNLSITQVSQKTRIPRDFIINVEADAVDQLPAGLYTRSYITQLCREYEIDSAEILARYRRELGPAGGTAEGDPRAAVRRLQGEAGQPRYRPPIPCKVHRGNMLRHVSRYAVLGALLLLVALVLAAFGIQHYKNLRPPLDPGDPLPIRPPAVDVEEFIIPQELPLIELPVPES